MLVLSVESMVEVKEMEAAHVTSAKAVVLLHDTSFNSSRKPKLLRLIPEGELFVFSYLVHSKYGFKIHCRRGVMGI